MLINTTAAASMRCSRMASLMARKEVPLFDAKNAMPSRFPAMVLDRLNCCLRVLPASVFSQPESLSANGFDGHNDAIISMVDYSATGRYFWFIRRMVILIVSGVFLTH
ncbi:hypothetical protein [Rhizobium sp. 768_B6_N1_8]|uniref:hypothetical protein n=1 Tax=unclassified Rhizobium TaxID=2613769 RepID=UPI003F1EEFF4